MSTTKQIRNKAKANIIIREENGTKMDFKLRPPTIPAELVEFKLMLEQSDDLNDLLTFLDNKIQCCNLRSSKNFFIATNKKLLNLWGDKKLDFMDITCFKQQYDKL